MANPLSLRSFGRGGSNAPGRQYSFRPPPLPSGRDTQQIISDKLTQQRITPGTLGASYGGQGLSPDARWAQDFPTGPSADRARAAQAAPPPGNPNSAPIYGPPSAQMEAHEANAQTPAGVPFRGSTPAEAADFYKGAAPSSQAGNMSAADRGQLTSGQTLSTQWQANVLKNHPEIGVAGSEGNKAFVSAYQDALNKQGAGNFDPVKLADDTMGPINMSRDPNLANVGAEENKMASAASSKATDDQAAKARAAAAYDARNFVPGTPLGKAEDMVNALPGAPAKAEGWLEQKAGDLKDWLGIKPTDGPSQPAGSNLDNVQPGQGKQAAAAMGIGQSGKDITADADRVNNIAGVINAPPDGSNPNYSFERESDPAKSMGGGGGDGSGGGGGGNSSESDSGGGSSGESDSSASAASTTGAQTGAAASLPNPTPAGLNLGTGDRQAADNSTQPTVTPSAPAANTSEAAPEPNEATGRPNYGRKRSYSFPTANYATGAPAYGAAMPWNNPLFNQQRGQNAMWGGTGGGANGAGNFARGYLPPGVRSRVPNMAAGAPQFGGPGLSAPTMPVGMTPVSVGGLATGAGNFARGYLPAGVRSRVPNMAAGAPAGQATSGANTWAQANLASNERAGENAWAGDMKSGMNAANADNASAAAEVRGNMKAAGFGDSTVATPQVAASTLNRADGSTLTMNGAGQTMAPRSEFTPGYARGSRMPNYSFGERAAIERERRAIAKGVGGAKPGVDEPKVVDLRGIGRAVINSGERVVRRANGQDAVLTREMRKRRRFTPK